MCQSPDRGNVNWQNLRKPLPRNRYRNIYSGSSKRIRELIVTRSKTYIFNGRRHSGTTAVFFGAATSTRSVLTAGQLVAVGHRREGRGVWGCAPRTARWLEEHTVANACYLFSSGFSIFEELKNKIVWTYVTVFLRAFSKFENAVAELFETEKVKWQSRNLLLKTRASRDVKSINFATANGLVKPWYFKVFRLKVSILQPYYIRRWKRKGGDLIFEKGVLFHSFVLFFKYLLVNAKNVKVRTMFC